MAPSYEICAEESLVLSAEKYADARILLFTISMRPRCVGRSRPFRRFISQSQLIGFNTYDIAKYTTSSFSGGVGHNGLSRSR